MVDVLHPFLFCFGSNEKKRCWLDRFLSYSRMGHMRDESDRFCVSLRSIKTTHNAFNVATVYELTKFKVSSIDSWGMNVRCSVSIDTLAAMVLNFVGVSRVDNCLFVWKHRFPSGCRYRE